MLKLTQEFTFKDTDFDNNDELKASSLMYIFQEAAGEHAQQLNLGFDDLIANNNMWVLTKVRFKIHSTMFPNVEYRIETYPRPRKGITFYRDYYVYDSADNLMATGTSQWCIVNFETRKVERTRIDFDGEFIDHPAFDDGIAKIKAVNPVFSKSYKVGQEDLDQNEHVNNCRYADMIESVLGERGYSELSIHFVKEALLGDKIMLHKEEQDDGLLVMGNLSDDTVVFQAKVVK